MIAPDNSADITSQKVLQDLNTATDKYVVLKGCHGGRYQNKALTSISQKLTTVFKQIKNPFSVRNTSPWKIEVYKTLSGSTLSGKIIETDAIISSSQYSIETMDTLALDATLKTVQEATTHKF